MSGHNKWSQIKHKKAKTDGQKSKIFSKYARLLSLEAKACGGQLSAPKLRAVVEKAREANMPNDSIERAIKKGTGGPLEALETITYESYGPGGSAVIIDALTGNRNKAAQEIKHILSEHGAALAAPGSASWSFTKEGAEWIPTTTIPLSREDSLALETLINALEENDEVQEVFTNAEFAE